MKYINVDLRNLKIDIAVYPIEPKFQLFSIKTEGDNPDYLYQYLSNKILSEIFYPQLYEYQRQSRSLLPKGAAIGKTAYKISPPEPWLVSISALIWQGVIQGLTWDLLKYSVLSALSTLRKSKLVPPRWNYKKVFKSRKIGFVYEKISDEKLLYSYFLGFKSSYTKEINFTKKTLQEKNPIKKRKHLRKSS